MFRGRSDPVVVGGEGVCVCTCACEISRVNKYESRYLEVSTLSSGYSSYLYITFGVYSKCNRSPT